MRIERWNGFSVTNASSLEAQIAYIRLNSQTPCPPRGAVPVNQGCSRRLFHSQHPDRLRSWLRPSQLCQTKDFANSEDCSSQKLVIPVNGIPLTAKRMFFCALLTVALCVEPGISRARLYNVNTGRFQTMDTYEGNNEDPLSLHKYLYGWDNPVNNTDPSGHDIGEMLAVVDIFSGFFAQISPVTSQAAPSSLRFSPQNTTLGMVQRVLATEVREPGQPGFGLNDSEYGLWGVGAVIVNRVNSPKFPNTIEAVIKQPGQFAGFENYPVLPDYINNIISDLQNFANLKGAKIANYRLHMQDLLGVANKVVALDTTLDAFVPAGGPYIPTMYFRSAGSANPWGGPARQLPWYRDTAGGNDFYSDR